MSPREFAPPPQIPGFVFIKGLGVGGFADVYLYEQIRPRRQVAVKVLLAKMSGSEAEERLNREADAMAGLSQHQNIVTVFQSGTAPDGRAYMVMEYYSRPALSHGLKQSQRSLADILSIGIQLAGAVESAHRAGILHRDIKPANVMVDRGNRPVLGDFGIAMSNEEAARGEAQGLSVPWSPPESFAQNAHPSAQSDVWSLAATIYALLTGRAPFEIPGGDNRQHAVADRIKTMPYRPTGRADVPVSLEQVLSTAMAKSPQQRYTSMRAFGVALQEVEQELKLPITRMDIMDDAQEEDFGDDGEGTKLRPITVVDPSGMSRPGGFGGSYGGDTTGFSGQGSYGGTGGAGAIDTTGGTGATGGFGTTGGHGTTGGQPGLATASHPVGVGDTNAPIDATVFRSPHPDELPTRIPEAAPPAAPNRRGLVMGVIVGVAVLVIAAIIVTVVLLTRGDPSADQTTEAPPTTSVPQDPIGAEIPPQPADLSGSLDTAAGVAHFTWADPDGSSTQTWRYRVVGDTDEKVVPVTSAAADVPIPPDAPTVCVQVWAVRDGRSSEVAEGCAV